MNKKHLFFTVILLVFCVQKSFSIEEKQKQKKLNLQLIAAAKKGDLDEVKMLITSGADVKAKDNDYDWTPLHFAIFKAHTPVVKFLIEIGADVNASGKDKNTPLLLASHKHRGQPLSIIKFLIEHGANVNSTDNNGWTPLHIASIIGEAEVCDLLLKNHVNVLLEDNSKKTAEFYAKRYPSLALYRFLRKAKILAKYELLDPQIECSLCLEQFEPKELIAILGCGHSFHNACLTEYNLSPVLDSSKCPLCLQKTNTQKTKIFTRYKYREPNNSKEAKKKAIEEKPKDEKNN